MSTIVRVPLDKNAKIALLRRVPLFADCSRSELVEVAICADERDVPDGHELTREGERGREFFVLVEGTATVQRGGAKVADLGPGDWFGEIALLTYKRRSATVTATSPIRMLAITDRDFRRVVETTPRVALRVLASVARRLERDARS